MKYISNKGDALKLTVSLITAPRSSWITKGSRKKSNENIEIARDLAKELADHTMMYFILLEQAAPDRPPCDCSEIQSMLLKAIQQLPDGDLANEAEQIMFNYCPICGREVS